MRIIFLQFFAIKQQSPAQWFIPQTWPIHSSERRYRGTYYGIYTLGNIFRITHYLGISPTTSVAGTKTWAQCKQSDADAARHVSSLYLKMLKRQHIERNCMERKRNKVCNDSIGVWKAKFELLLTSNVFCWKYCAVCKKNEKISNVPNVAFRIIKKKHSIMSELCKLIAYIHGEESLRCKVVIFWSSRKKTKKKYLFEVII